MYKNFEIVPTRPAVGRLQLRAAYLAALLSTLALPGCVTFSPDGGMTVVANAADEILKNGCYFDSHGRRRGGGAQCRSASSSPSFDRRYGGADSAAQQPRPAGVVQRVGLGRSGACRRELATQPYLLHLAHRRRWSDGDRAAGGRGHPGIGDVAIPVGDRPAEIPEGATSCRRGDAAVGGGRPA